MEIFSIDLPADLWARHGYAHPLEGQAEVIRHILAGRDVIALIPPGGGRRAIVRMAAELAPGHAIYITPCPEQPASGPRASAPEEEDYARLSSGKAVVVLCPNLTESQIARRIDLASDSPSVLLVLPLEMLTLDLVQSVLGDAPVSFAAIDESQRVSPWSHDWVRGHPGFGAIRGLLSPASVVAFGATDSNRVLDEIAGALAMASADRVLPMPDRRGMRLRVEMCADDDARIAALYGRMRSGPGPTVVYARDPGHSVHVASMLEDMGLVVEAIHGDRAGHPLTSDISLVDAIVVPSGTCLKAMGIAPKRIFHVWTPASLPVYLANLAGAAPGAVCTLLATNDDLEANRSALESSPDDPQIRELARQRLAGVEAYIGGEDCRWTALVKGATPGLAPRTCGECDVCAPPAAATAVRADLDLLELLAPDPAAKKARGKSQRAAEPETKEVAEEAPSDGILAAEAEAPTRSRRTRGPRQPREKTAPSEIPVLAAVVAPRRADQESESLCRTAIDFVRNSDGMSVGQAISRYATDTSAGTSQTPTVRRAAFDALLASGHLAVDMRPREGTIAYVVRVAKAEPPYPTIAVAEVAAAVPAPTPAPAKSAKAKAEAQTDLEMILGLDPTAKREKPGRRSRRGRDRGVKDSTEAAPATKEPAPKPVVEEDEIDSHIAGALRAADAMRQEGKRLEGLQRLEDEKERARPGRGERPERGDSRRRGKKEGGNGQPAAANQEIGAEDYDLLAKLQAWRREAARERDIKPYIIMSDKNLAEIARNRPLTRDDLRALKGIGPKKVDNWGDEILQIVNQAGRGMVSAVPTGESEPGVAEPIGPHIERLSLTNTRSKIDTIRRLKEIGDPRAIPTLDELSLDPSEPASIRLYAGIVSTELAGRSSRPKPAIEVAPTVAAVQPKKLRGGWDVGYALADLTAKSEQGWERTPIGHMVHRFRTEPDDVLIAELADTVTGFVRGNTQYRNGTPIVLAVPSVSGRNGRSELPHLIQEIAKRLGYEAGPKVLATRRETHAQLTQKGRIRKYMNVKGAFEVAEPSRVRDRMVIVVDDLYDTGHTLGEITRQLRKAGAQKVAVVALARTVKESPI